MPNFNGGVSKNTHVKGKKLCHLRVKAGPQRDQYVHSLIFQAKILGRREAWIALHPDGTPPPEDDFYRYIDLTFETVDHDDNDSLNNSPENLVRMTRGDNTIKANRRRAIKKEKEISRAEDAPF
jgi:hypothetical protein